KTTNRPCPKRSSTLSPKIHRYHMLPITCDQLPCRNIDVKRVETRKWVGTTPYASRKPGSTSLASDSSNNQAVAFRMMMLTVTKGVVRDGMMSRSGIIHSL